MSKSQQHPIGGFTLIEVMIAMTISMIALAGVMEAFIHQNKAYQVQDEVTQMQQNLRATMDLLVEDIRMAGYGAPPADNLNAWVSWLVMDDANPDIDYGATPADPDQITIVAAFGDDMAYLAQRVQPGDNRIFMTSGSGSLFNNTTKRLMFVGRTQFAQIRNISGDTVTGLDTIPGGSKTNFPSDMLPIEITTKTGDPRDMPVQLVSAITYFIRDNQLWRDDNLNNADSEVLVAEGIENMKVQDDTHPETGTHVITITLTGRTWKEDPNYTHPTEGDGYRRVTLTTQVNVRSDPEDVTPKAP